MAALRASHHDDKLKYVEHLLDSLWLAWIFVSTKVPGSLQEALKRIGHPAGSPLVLLRKSRVQEIQTSNGLKRLNGESSAPYRCLRLGD
jgi:hypothetical protein